MAQRLKVRDFGTSLYSINGSATNRVDTGFHPSFLGTGFSVSCWAKPSDYKSGINNESTLWGVNAATSNGLFVFMNGNSGGQKNINASNGSVQLNGNVQLNPGTYYHIVVTYDGTTLKTYINAVIDINSAMTYTDNSSNLFLMARTSTASAYRPWAGFADDFILFNKALSQTEVINLYYNDVIPSGATNRWKFDEGTGSTALDSVGSNNATITGLSYTPDVPMIPRSLVRSFGTGLNFNGTSSNVSLGTSSTLEPTGSKTMSVWFKSTLVNSSAFIFGRAYDDVAGADAGWRINLNNGALNGGITSLTTGNFVDVTASYKVDFGWNLGTLVFDSTSNTSTLYLNGNVVGVASVSGGYRTTTNRGVSSTPTTVGQYSVFGSQFFQGLIDEPRIWNVALTAAQVSDVYYKNIIPSGVVGEWLFNEGAGTTAIDTSGNSNTGTITGATYTGEVPLKLRSQVPTTPQTALKFGSASTDRVDCGTDFLGTGDITISAWINPTSVGAIGGRIIDNGKIIFQVAAINNLRLSSDGATFADAGDQSLAYNGQWRLATVTRTAAGTANIYINAILMKVANQASGTPAAGTTNTIIGNNGALSRNFDGKIKDLRVFNRVLTQAEIVSLYYSATSPSGTEIVRYSTNEGAGTSLTDATGNGHNGTITGATYVKDAPYQPRKIVGGNLVVNGDFSFVPPFVALQNTTGWINGTSSGQPSNPPGDIFGWYIQSSSGSAAISPGLFTSTLTAGGGGFYVDLVQDPNFHNNSNTSQQHFIPVLPNTSYTISVMMRGYNGATAGSLGLLIRWYNGQTLVNGTNGYPFSFTSSLSMQTNTLTSPSNASFLAIGIANGNTFGLANGVSGQSMDVASVSVTPTVNTVRSQT